MSSTSPNHETGSHDVADGDVLDSILLAVATLPVATLRDRAASWELDDLAAALDATSPHGSSPHPPRHNAVTRRWVH